jgi:hypothetical protein
MSPLVIPAAAASSSVKGALFPLGTFHGTGSATTASFQNIPQGYQDLMFHVYAQANNLNTTISLRFNNDSGTNYSYYHMHATGASLGAGSFGTNFSDINGSAINFFIPKSDGYFFTATYHIINYANTTNWKQMLVEYGMDVNAVSGSELGTLTNSYRSTSGINRVDIYCRDNGAAFSRGTAISLYGVRAKDQ